MKNLESLPEHEYSHLRDLIDREGAINRQQLRTLAIHYVKSQHPTLRGKDRTEKINAIHKQLKAYFELKLREDKK